MTPPQDSSPLWPSVVTVALTGTSFLAGLLVGHRLRRPWRRLVMVAKTGPTKMVLVVQGNLKMGRGKLAAQCCHGTLAAYRRAQRCHPELLQAWEDTGQAKVVLKVDTEQEMLKVAEEAERQGVGVAVVRMRAGPRYPVAP
ncbi:putative peptidyl-tRNA hydrolase 2 [Chionoecetes opilio]|uniref:peptidyl-tRNA hydrolase n=1 Tax=Chionoecetes opilio TaxID=41210 RepID=A0A8J5CUE1_CHIOP|nr:putative peptidyl-tRNA hydrolase 2 [Chionoecetes opilio]